MRKGAEGWDRYVRNQAVKDGPLVLQGTAVGCARVEDGGDFVSAAADAEGADRSLFDFGFEQGQEGVVLQIAGGCLVEEPEVNVVAAEGSEAAVEGGFGLGGGEGGTLGVAGGGVGCFRQTGFEAGEFLEDWASDAAAEFDDG